MSTLYFYQVTDYAVAVEGTSVTFNVYKAVGGVNEFLQTQTLTFSLGKSKGFIQRALQNYTLRFRNNDKDNTWLASIEGVNQVVITE